MQPTPPSQPTEAAGLSHVGPAAPAAVSVTLEADPVSVVYSESIFFHVVVTNTGKAVLPDAPTLKASNHSIWLEATCEERKVRGSVAAMGGRQMKYGHGPESKEVRPFAPGENRTIDGDVVAWCGELEPGDWSIVAVYKHGMNQFRSAPVVVKIINSNAVDIQTPRYGLRAADAPSTLLWVHKPTPSEAAGGPVLFVQERVQGQPAVAFNGHRMLGGPAGELAAATVSTLAYPKARFDHVVWANSRGFVTARIDRTAPRSPVTNQEFAAPFEPTVLNNPLSLMNGAVAVACVNASHDRLAAVVQTADGETHAAVLEIGKGEPITSSAMIWEWDDRLHAVWARSGAREMQYARAVLNDLSAGFSSPLPTIFDDKVIWIDGGVDPSPQRTPGRPDDELEPPRGFAVVVTQRPERVSIWRVDLQYRLPLPVASFNTKEAGPVRVIHSAVTPAKHLRAIVAGADDRLWYLSSEANRLVLLSKSAGADVTLKQQPGIVVSGPSGVRTWVYLRFLDTEARRVRMVKLEPVDVPDPLIPVPPPPPLDPGVESEDDGH